MHIHSMRIDQQGNIIGAPPSYGDFFIKEAERSPYHRTCPVVSGSIAV